MTLSLNEIESLARKAARGAGLDWGLAEEAGKATRWLCAAGWPGAEILAKNLSRIDGVSYNRLRPADTDGIWTAPDGRLCPLIAGAALLDRSSAIADGEIRLGPIGCPMLLIPYLAWVADRTGATLGIAWPGVQITRGKGETHVTIQSFAALTAPEVQSVRAGPARQRASRQISRAYRAEIPSGAHRALEALAHRTYAPDTPESRLAGAGAGLRDND